MYSFSRNPGKSRNNKLGVDWVGKNRGVDAAEQGKVDLSSMMQNEINIRYEWFPSHQILGQLELVNAFLFEVIHHGSLENEI